MPDLKIPSEYDEGIALIKSLSLSDVERVVEVLKGARPSSDAEEIVQMLSPTLASVPEENVREFAGTLYSLYLFRAHSDVSINQFIEDLCDAMMESDNPKVRTTKADELIDLKKKFMALLTVRPLSTLSKAHGLRYEFANVFWDAKVVSDIRPVWEDDARKPPQGVVLTQTLKLEYHYAGGHGELYVCLDDHHIDKLISVLKRAQEKRSTLRSLAKDSWMTILDE